MQPKTRQWLQSALVVAVLLALAWWLRDSPSGTAPATDVAQATSARPTPAGSAAAVPPTRRPRSTPTSPISGSPPRGTPIPTRAPATATPRRATPTRGPAVQPTRETDGMARIDVDDLPPEARETLRLIDQGGPFPFDKDGSVFSNRERILPRQPGGYYREYTVITPGEDDRGARRIVAGASSELYYTDDHYASFRRIQK